jgi:Arc/MetJ-type ribon-helix-helix transcriptional regulator
MRPQLSVRAEDIVKMFIERNVFETQSETIEQALELLLKNQLDKESAESNKINDEYFLNAQLEVLNNRGNDATPL